LGFTVLTLPFVAFDIGMIHGFFNPTNSFNGGSPLDTRILYFVFSLLITVAGRHGGVLEYSQKNAGMPTRVPAPVSLAKQELTEGRGMHC
jgi:hypothetical protein